MTAKLTKVDSLFLGRQVLVVTQAHLRITFGNARASEVSCSAKNLKARYGALKSRAATRVLAFRVIRLANSWQPENNLLN